MRAYSFVYKPDVVSTMNPWRAKLGESYEEVLALLADRDRQIENHVNLTVGQGYLAIADQTGGAFAIPTADYADIPGMTATIDVPTNRQIKVTSSVFIENVSAGADTFVFTRVNLDGVTVRSEYLCHGAPGKTGGPQGHSLVFFTAVTPGPHTLTTQTISLAAGMATNTVVENFLSVEDTGPPTR